MTLRLACKAGPSPAERRAAFAARLAQEDEANAAMILRTVGDALALDADDLRPADAEAAEALAEWDDWVAPLADPSDAARIEDDILHRFASRLNALRQQALGIDRYVWRTRDDARVRPAHARHDDRAFDWEEPPEGGHPGEDRGCRCWAEPVLPEAEDDVPRTGLDLAQFRLRAEVAGMGAAIRDTVAETVHGLAETALLGRDLDRWARLRLEAALGLASEEDREDLEEVEARFAERAAAAESAVRAAMDPATWAAFRDYLLAARARPALVADAYAAGLATEGQLWEAHRERAQVDTLLILALVPATIARRALGAAGRAEVPDDPGALRRMLAEETARLRRAPDDHGFAVIADPGIPWGGGIMAQGRAWEDALERDFGFRGRLPDGFGTFDFFDRDTTQAVSAKTLDTNARTSALRTAAIYSRLRLYVDRAAAFEFDERSGVRLTAEEIGGRSLVLAIPEGTTPEQMMQIQRAVEDAASRGINLQIMVLE